MSDTSRPVKLMIAAMGGEGGGVLTSWIVAAARAQGLPVQATSIPGVAQRTGATTYYIEIMPVPYSELGDVQPVMDLFPGVGDIDLMVATELLETARAMERGFVNPERTTLVASTHRVYSILEKTAMGDGRVDGEKILAAANQMAKRRIMFDMEKVSQRAGSVINAVVLGAIAGSGVLPIPPEVFENGIKAEGKAVKANLAGFAAGLAYARGEVVEAPTRQRAARDEPARPAEPTGEALALKTRIERDYPAAVHPIVMEATGRVLDYQNAAYAKLYLDRLDTVLAIDKARGDNDFTLTRETGRHLALRMAFEDVVRVAQLKTRASRFERVRKEVQATPEQPVEIKEFLKPGPEEFCAILPSFIARPILNWAERNPAQARKLHIGMHIKTNTILGFLLVRMMAALRPFRPWGHRYKAENAQIEAWLDLVRRAAERDRRLGLEVVECARLIKGYGDTHKRGTGNFARITEALIRPAVEEGQPIAPEAIKRARDAALADPEGLSLGKVLAELAQPAQVQAAQ
ncbi:MAG TPA: indolepyruvate oxidoreductase subunit beta family protein [Alphaproteobacteria bacterium]|jgi:indolepyruvate ferredoxin oxidoreductase beta subunit